MRSTPCGPLLTRLLAAAAVAAGTLPAAAQTPSAGQEVLAAAVNVDVGAFITDWQVKARLDAQSRTNPEYDFNKEFGGNDSRATRFRLDGIWRINPTHHLRLMYFSNTREGARSIDKEIHWGDTTYTVGARIAMETKQQVVEVAYEWAFLRTRDYEVAGTFGIHYMGITAQLSGNGYLTDGSNGTQVSFTTKRSSFPVPLPVVGIRGAWAVGRNWYLDASGQLFKARVGDYDGLIQDLRANATWMVNRHVGVGLGYNAFLTTIDVSRGDYQGRLRMGYSGFQAFLKTSF